jgi:hypothetical protein
MELIKKEKLDLTVKKEYAYSFDVPESRLYLIEIMASAQSWWQNFSGRRSFLKADYLSVQVNRGIFPRLSGSQSRKDLFLSPLAWNGNELKGLIKANIFIINLPAGKNDLKFVANQYPMLRQIAVFKISSDEAAIEYRPDEIATSQDGDRYPWISLATVGVAIKDMSVSALAGKYPRSRDDDDLKLVIDGQAQANKDKKSHRDWFWCGKILNGSAAIFKLAVNWTGGRHYLELWADRKPRLNFIKLSIQRDLGNPAAYPYKNRSSEWWEKWKAVKQYSYRGPKGDQDYNRYDALIIKAVAHWNKEFCDDIYPPDEPLDPSLVKAMMLQESHMGYDKTAGIDVMQIGNDQALGILNHATDAPEHEIKHGKLWDLNYVGKAKMNSVADGIYWGVRWLYHKAQRVDETWKIRTWWIWRKAVEEYGPHDGIYTDHVWQMYTAGIDSRQAAPLKLWSFILILVLAGLLFGWRPVQPVNPLLAATWGSLDQGYRDMTQNIEIQRYQGEDNSLFFSIVTEFEDWWESLKVGRQIGEEIKWLEIDKPPHEQAILSAKFVDLHGFDQPLLEVYGYSHRGTGYFYLYEIGDDGLRLVLSTIAVDQKNASHSYLGNVEKYGYWHCDARFIDKRLAEFYTDLNGDGTDDVKLSGRQEVVCDVVKPESLTDAEPTVETYDLQVDEYPVEKIFFWDTERGAYRLDKISPSKIWDSF